MKFLYLLGDSHIAKLNRFYDDSPAYKFKESFPNTKIVDLTLGGANIKDGLNIVKNEKLDKGSSAVVMYGTNDAAYWKQIPLKEFKKVYQALVNNLARRNLKIFLITPPPVNIRKQKPPGRSNDVINRYAEVVRSIADDMGFKLIDLFKFINERKDKQDFHDKDGVHLNEKGYEILIKKLKNKLHE